MTGLTQVILTGLTLYVTVTDLLSHVILFLPTTAETHRRRNSSLLYCSPPQGRAPVCVLGGGGPREMFIWYASVCGILASVYCVGLLMHLSVTTTYC